MARGRGPVLGVRHHREALRRDQLGMAALRGVVVIIVQQVGIVHRLHPAANVAARDRFDHACRLHGLADLIVEVRAIAVGGSHFTVSTYLL